MIIPRTSRRLPLLFAALTLMLPATSEAQLRWKFKEGQTSNYVMEQKIDVIANVQGNEVTTEMTQTMDMTWQVKSIDDDGNAQMSQTINRVRSRMKAPFGNIDYDSDTEEAPAGPIGAMMAKMFEAMVKQEFLMTMSPRGEVSDMKLPKKLTDSLGNNPGGGAIPGFTPDSMKQMMSNSGIVFPEGELTVDKTWSNKVEAAMPLGKMVVSNEYKYLGSEERRGKKLDKIAMKPSLKLEAKENALVKATLKDQEASGTLYFDKAAGRLVESSIKQNMTIQVEVGGMVIDQKFNQTTTMKLADSEKSTR